jgi:pyruvate formate lyase activating enzyme
MPVDGLRMVEQGLAAYGYQLDPAVREIWIRFVLVPELTDEPSNVEGIARFAALLSTVERVEVLPFHRLGVAKYAALGIPFPLPRTPPPDDALLGRVRGQFAEQGLTVC